MANFIWPGNSPPLIQPLKLISESPDFLRSSFTILNQLSERALARIYTQPGEYVVCQGGLL